MWPKGPLDLAKQINENNIGAFQLHRREWQPVFSYPSPVLPSDRVGVLPTFQEVNFFKKYFQGGRGVPCMSFW